LRENDRQGRRHPVDETLHFDEQLRYTRSQESPRTSHRFESKI
jgi:hypothetical protein